MGSNNYDRMLREIRLINTEEAYLLAWLRRLVEPSKRVPVPYESLDIDVEIRRWQERFGATSGGTATPMETHILRDDLTRDYAARFAADYRQAYRADDPGTHVAHWVVYNPETDSLDSRTDPDSMVLPG